MKFFPALSRLELRKGTRLDRATPRMVIIEVDTAFIAEQYIRKRCNEYFFLLVCSSHTKFSCFQVWHALMLEARTSYYLLDIHIERHQLNTTNKNLSITVALFSTSQ